MKINAEDPNSLSTFPSFCLSYSHVHLSPCLSIYLSVLGVIFSFLVCLSVGVPQGDVLVCVCFHVCLSYMCGRVFVCSVCVLYMCLSWSLVCCLCALPCLSVSYFAFQLLRLSVHVLIFKLFTCLPVGFLVSVPVYLFVPECIYLFVFQFVYLFTCLSPSSLTCLFLSVSVRLPVFPSQCSC